MSHLSQSQAEVAAKVDAKLKLQTLCGDLSVRNRADNETSRGFVPSSRWKLYLEHIGGDEALPLLVVDPERLLQLLLHLLLVILDQELGGHLDR